MSRRSTTGSGPYGGENALCGKTRRRPPSPLPSLPPPTDSLGAGITRALFRHRRARRQSRVALGVVCIATAVASRVPRPTTIVHEARRRVLADSAIRRHRKFFRFLQLRTVANGTWGPIVFVSVDR